MTSESPHSIKSTRTCSKSVGTQVDLTEETVPSSNNLANSEEKHGISDFTGFESTSKLQLWVFVTLIVEEFLVLSGAIEKLDKLTYEHSKYINDLAFKVVEPINPPRKFFTQLGKTKKYGQKVYKDMKRLSSYDLRLISKDSKMESVLIEVIRNHIYRFLVKFKSWLEILNKFCCKKCFFCCIYICETVTEDEVILCIMNACKCTTVCCGCVTALMKFIFIFV